jgi:hypothetical protein
MSGGNPQPPARTVIALVCPECRHHGAFTATNNLNDLAFNLKHLPKNDFPLASFRFCPNPECQALVVLFYTNAGRVLGAFPAVTIDFDKANIPEKILDCLQEAITCHAHGCYKACAMMIRKTLETLCQNQNATGSNLSQRIDALRATIVMPQALMDALHELRLLGNDAAHITSKDYDDVGREEVETAIELTKEILKAVFQYQHLLGRLTSLKKATTPPAAGP